MLGLDLIDIARVEKAAQSEHFYRRVFSESERRYYEANGRRAETLAGFFAAKEAAVKALKTGFSGIWPGDISVGHDKNGSPYLSFSGRAAILLGTRRAELSITHTDTAAAAVCLIL